MEKTKIFLELDYLKNNATLFMSNGEQHLMHMGQPVNGMDTYKKLNLFLSFHDIGKLNLATKEPNIKRTVGTIEAKNLNSVLKNWNDNSFRSFEIDQLGQYKTKLNNEEIEPYFLDDLNFIHTDIWFEKDEIVFRDKDTYELEKYSADGYDFENDIKIKTNLKTTNEKFLFLNQIINNIDRTAFLQKPEDLRNISEVNPISLKSLSCLDANILKISEDKNMLLKLENNIINRQKNKSMNERE